MVARINSFQNSDNHPSGLSEDQFQVLVDLLTPVSELALRQLHSLDTPNTPVSKSKKD